MPTGIFNAGYPVLGRSPAPYLYRPSQWSDNVFWVKCVEESGGDLVVSTFVQSLNDYNPILLFCQDRPGILNAATEYVSAVMTDDNADTFTVPLWHFWETDIFQVINAAIAPVTNLITNPVPAAPADGQRITAETATNGVEVSGHLFGVDIQNRDLETALGADLEPNLRVLLVGQSGVQAGPNSTGELVAYDGSGPTFGPADAVILAESDYTQAIRDAGNVVVAGNGTFRVVGIHHATQVA